MSREPLFIAFFSGAITIVAVVINIIYTNSHSGKKAIFDLIAKKADKEEYDRFQTLLNGKVDRTECDKSHDSVQRFKERMGMESDLHRNSITRLEKGMIFVVEKLGGNPAQMGFME